MRAKTADGDDAPLRTAREIRQRGGGQFVKRRSHHRERALQSRPGQLREIASVGKARGMHDRIDLTERGARGMDEFGCRTGIGEIAVTPLDPGAGPLTVGSDCFQSIEPGRVGALSVQHQALIIGRQSPRDRGANSGSAAGDDGNSHKSMVLAHLTRGL